MPRRAFTKRLNGITIKLRRSCLIKVEAFKKISKLIISMYTLTSLCLLSFYSPFKFMFKCLFFRKLSFNCQNKSLSTGILLDILAFSFTQFLKVNYIVISLYSYLIAVFPIPVNLGFYECIFIYFSLEGWLHASSNTQFASYNVC